MSKKYNFKKDVVETYNSRHIRTGIKPKDRPKDHGSTIYVHNGNIDNAIKRMKLFLDMEDRQRELARKEYYEKPSVKRKRVKSQAIKRNNKNIHESILNGDYRPSFSKNKKQMKKKKQRRRNFLVETIIGKIKKTQ